MYLIAFLTFSWSNLLKSSAFWPDPPRVSAELARRAEAPCLPGACGAGHRCWLHSCWESAAAKAPRSSWRHRQRRRRPRRWSNFGTSPFNPFTWGYLYILYGYGSQYLLIPFLVGWTSIYQLFWCSPGVQGFDTLPYKNMRVKMKKVGWRWFPGLPNKLEDLRVTHPCQQTYKGILYPATMMEWEGSICPNYPTNEGDVGIGIGLPTMM